MTTQDTGLVEAAGRAAYEQAGAQEQYHPPWSWLSRDMKIIWRSRAGAALTATLPHLSPESQALLRKELNGE